MIETDITFDPDFPLQLNVADKTFSGLWGQIEVDIRRCRTVKDRKW
jgi:hypothetical protein